MCVIIAEWTRRVRVSLFVSGKKQTSGCFNETWFLLWKAIYTGNKRAYNKQLLKPDYIEVFLLGENHLNQRTRKNWFISKKLKKYVLIKLSGVIRDI